VNFLSASEGFTVLSETFPSFLKALRGRNQLYTEPIKQRIAKADITLAFAFLSLWEDD